MSDQKTRLDELEARLDRLVRTQVDFQNNIFAIREEIERLRNSGPQTETKPQPISAVPSPVRPVIDHVPTPVQPNVHASEPAMPEFSFGYGRKKAADPDKKTASNVFEKHADSARTNLEKFIGENLISKIGVLVLIIGIGIGVKYSIDNDLISPLTRIIIAYIFGFGLAGLGLKLRKKYLNFSSALFSGGMATAYFVTYFAYTAYALIGRTPAFALMVLFTILTVAAALYFNRQVIAHIGLVGAYAVPFMVKDNSGNFAALFTYMAIINCGILAISVKKHWSPIIYTASLFTWLIFGVWYAYLYVPEVHFNIAILFAAIFFLLLYVAALIHRLTKENSHFIQNTGLVLNNSFLFFGFGYSILNGNETANGMLGLYAAGHSAFHLMTAYIVSTLKPRANDVVQVLAVLIITFASIAVPVQFDGNVVTIVWAVEAAVLFYLGRTRGLEIFEFLSFPVMMLAVGSMFIDWATAYSDRTSYTSELNRPVFANGDFITAIVVVAAFSWIFIVNRDKNKAAIPASLIALLGYAAGGVALFVLYNMFRIEIGNYFHLQAVQFNEVQNAEGNYGVSSGYAMFSAAWQTVYTMIFIAVMALINTVHVRSRSLSVLSTFAGYLAMFIFVTAGMLILYDIRTMTGGHAGEWARTSIRYFSYAAAGFLLYSLYKNVISGLLDEWVPRKLNSLMFEGLLYSSAFIAASCELLHVMAYFGIGDGTKLGLSILWGIYALMMIIIGIAFNKKHLRIAAIVLLAFTLLKLFFYDAAELETIPRTILFVTLGITLLAVSFLYNKYKNVIFGFAEDEEEGS